MRKLKAIATVLQTGLILSLHIAAYAQAEWVSTGGVSFMWAGKQEEVSGNGNKIL